MALDKFRLQLNRRQFCIASTGLLGTCVATNQSDAATKAPIVATKYGKVRGYHDGPVTIFKNIPYGATTAGANRWMPPLPPAKWRGIKDTLAPGFMAPQSHDGPIAEEAVMLQKDPKGEECLNVNVYTPGADTRSRPVMVWFHGGVFASGSGNADSTDGGNMAAHHDVVFVTVTHRLNVFGYLYLGDLLGPSFASSGNVGMLDCVAALQWVRDNIAQFGGDPGNVTIVGQSGGGMKVSTLLAMPSAAGLFHRAIIQSGGLVRATAKEQAATNAKRLVDMLGVSTASQLQALSWQDIIAAMESLRLQTGPVVDGHILPSHPFDPGAPDVSRKIPLMLGATETESTFFPFIPLDPIDDAKLVELVKASTRASDVDVTNLIQVFRRTYPDKENVYLLQLLTSQNGFQVGVETIAERKSAQDDAPVYFYYFSKHTPVRSGKLRSPHTLDIPYVFDNLRKATSIAGPVTAMNQALADKTSATWASFARTGNPNNPTIPHWPKFATTTRATMIIDDALKVVNDPLHDTRVVLADMRLRTSPQLPPR